MIDKNYWLDLHFVEGKQSDITCPTCGTAKINILEKFVIHQTRNTIELLKQGDYDTENLDAKFSGLLICNNENCNDVISVCGTAFPERIDDYEESYTNEYLECLKPEYFSPSLKIFPLKPEYPKSVKEILESPFRCFLLIPILVVIKYEFQLKYF